MRVARSWYVLCSLDCHFCGLRTCACHVWKSSDVATVLSLYVFPPVLFMFLKEKKKVCVQMSINVQNKKSMIQPRPVEIFHTFPFSHGLRVAG